MLLGSKNIPCTKHQDMSAQPCKSADFALCFFLSQPFWFCVGKMALSRV